MLDPLKTDPGNGKSMLKRFVLARAVIIGIVAVSCGWWSARNAVELDLTTVLLNSMFVVVLVESVIVYGILTYRYMPTMRFSLLLLCGDLLFITAVVVLTGGSRSVFAFLYIAAILSASILFSFTWSHIIATVCSVLFVVAVILEQNGYVVNASAFEWLGPPLTHGDLWAYTGLKVFAFYLAAFLSGYLSRRVGLLQSYQQDILNSFSSGFISTDRDGNVTYLNPAGVELLQCSDSNLLGRQISSVFAPADGQPSPLEDVLEGRSPCQGKEIVVTRGDGKLVPIGVTASPLREENGRLIGAVASFVDLTERKRMEEELRRADRLATIAEMSACLAHEIRNPVASIRSAVQELGENLRVAETEGQLIEIAIKESDQLNDIVSGFLDFFCDGPRRTEAFVLKKLLEEAIRTAEETFAENGSVCVLLECGDDVGSVVGDRGQIMEALSKVISNGIEMMDEGGKLRVRAYRIEESPDHVRILVQDEGTGFSTEGVQKLFDPFYSTGSRGVGAGMAIVQRIISLHDGSVDVESTEGKGTTIIIELPRED